MSRGLRTLLVLLVTGTLGFSVARAGAELVLQDGRTVSGTEVRRQGDNYHLTQPDGQVLTIPVQLVRELRLVEEGAPPRRPAPTAMRAEGPEILVGPPEPVEPPVADEQLAVLGPKATFRSSIFDPIWVPTSDWTLDPAQNDFNPARWFTAPIDPEWRPYSAFDGRVDVFAGTRSVWARSVIDPVWWPTGTTWLTSREPEVEPQEAVSETSPEETEVVADKPTSLAIEPMPATALAQFTPAGRPETRGGRVAPEICAREIFRPLTSRSDRGVDAPVSVAPVVDDSLATLSVDLYRGRLELDGRSYSALFSTEGDTCRLIGGDLDPLLGITLGDAERVEHSLRSYERAVGSRPRPAAGTAAEKVSYALSLVVLADPATSRGTDEAPTLLATRDELERLGAVPAERCTIGIKKRAREIERALADFAPPTVLAAERGDVVTLRTWSAEGGTVAFHTVRLSTAGTTSIERRVVAGHVGAHHDEKARK